MRWPIDTVFGAFCEEGVEVVIAFRDGSGVAAGCGPEPFRLRAAGSISGIALDAGKGGGRVGLGRGSYGIFEDADRRTEPADERWRPGKMGEEWRGSMGDG